MRRKLLLAAEPAHVLFTMRIDAKASGGTELPPPARGPHSPESLLVAAGRDFVSVWPIDRAPEVLSREPLSAMRVDGTATAGAVWPLMGDSFVLANVEGSLLVAVFDRSTRSLRAEREHSIPFNASALRTMPMPGDELCARLVVGTLDGTVHLFEGTLAGELNMVWEHQLTSSVTSLANLPALPALVVAGLESGTFEVLVVPKQGVVARGTRNVDEHNEIDSTLVPSDFGHGLPISSVGWSGKAIVAEASVMEPTSFAVTMLDGRIAVCDVTAGLGGELVWKRRWATQTNGALFALAALGHNVWAMCGWDGIGRVCGQRGDVLAQIDVAAATKAPVVAFAAGNVPGHDGEPIEPFLAFACADGQILVYTSLPLETPP